ncbi:MAG: phosphotransferase [Candidatus Brockarchaeota archaeon]|nr:phosphotransferase [Candidatus Brockarchaeota archaeon]
MGRRSKSARLVEKLQAYLESRGLDGLIPAGRVSVKSLSLYEKQGLSNEMYLVKIGTAGGGAKDLMLRLYAGDGKKALREYKLLKLLGRKNLPVPKVYAVEVSGKILGKPFLIMEKVEETPPREEREAMDAAAMSLVEVHKLEPVELEGILERKGAYPLSEFNDLKAMLVVLAFSTHRILGSFPKYWKQVKMLEVEGRSVSSTPRLVHGDYGLDNVVHKEGKAYVVDWESAEIAEPTLDVAYTCNMLGFGDELAGRRENKLSDSFLEAYRRHGGTTRDLDFYKRLAALKLLLMIEILGFPSLFSIFVGRLRKTMKKPEVRLLFGKLREYLLCALEDKQAAPTSRNP